jgi:DNA-3-methyladenine glycosylase
LIKKQNYVNIRRETIAMTILTADFFARPAVTVARDLLGQYLVREVVGQRLSGLIVETEAYTGPEDTACHAAKGRTTRTEVMFGRAGLAYVYLIYGMHSMLNLVTDQVDFPAAVLIRAIEPQVGVETMRQLRRYEMKRLTHLTNGPGKLCQALSIDRQLNGWDVTQGQSLWLEAGEPIAASRIMTGPRIGIDYAALPDREAAWRFWISGNPFVCKVT